MLKFLTLKHCLNIEDISCLSTSKQNWSTYSFIHLIKRNQLHSKKAKNLVYMHSDLCLLSHKQHSCKEAYMRLWDTTPMHNDLDASTSKHAVLQGLNNENTFSASTNACNTSNLPTSSNVNIYVHVFEDQYDISILIV